MSKFFVHIQYINIIRKHFFKNIIKNLTKNEKQIRRKHINSF